MLQDKLAYDFYNILIAEHWHVVGHFTQQTIIILENNYQELL
jgi:hypothetical protein